MGKDCLQTFLNLNISVKDSNNVEACMIALENYFKLQPNVVYKRYVFNSCEQNQGDSVDRFPGIVFIQGYHVITLTETKVSCHVKLMET